MIKTLTVGELQTNCYILIHEKLNECIIIDPGAEADNIINEIHKLKVKYIINTHCHADHIGAIPDLIKKFDCQIALHRQDLRLLSDPVLNLSATFSPANQEKISASRILEEGDKIKIGDYLLKVLHTPGHTPGSICLLADGFIFTGDTLFCGSVGRWDLPGGDVEALKSSIKKLSRLERKLKIYPGHGPSCNLSDELTHNPYFTESSLYD